MSTFRIICDAAIETGCADLLPILEQSKRDVRQSVAAPNGFSVLPRMNGQGLSAMDLRAAIMAAGPADYNILCGDSIPFFWVPGDVYGHGAESIPADGLFFAPGPLAVDGNNRMTQSPGSDPLGTYSRIYYKSQPTDTESSLQLYRDEFSKIINNHSTALDYAVECWVDDHFNYANENGSYFFIGENTRAQIPGCLLRDKRGLGVIVTESSRTDGEWEALAQRPVLLNVNLDGGFPAGLYNTGFAKDWRRINPGAYLQVIFGSSQNELENPDNLMVAATTVPRCHTSYINWYGAEHLSLFLAGRPIGDVVLAPGFYWKRYLSSCHGDCSHMLTNEQLALADMQANIANLLTRQAGLEDSNTQIRQQIRDLQAGTGGGGDTSGPTNFALASNGGVASASSVYSPGFPVSAVNNADRRGTGWGNGAGGWNSASNERFPEWVQVDFPAAKSINKVVLFTLADAFPLASDPADALTFSAYGVVDFTVQVWNGTAWVQVAAVAGNNLVKRAVSFPAVSTAKVRVQITRAADGYCRIVEIEAFGP